MRRRGLWIVTETRPAHSLQQKLGALVLIGKKIGPTETQGITHVAQAIEAPVVERSGGGAENALNIPAGEFAELVWSDAALSTSSGDALG